MLPGLIAPSRLEGTLNTRKLQLSRLGESVLVCVRWSSLIRLDFVVFRCFKRVLRQIVTLRREMTSLINAGIHKLEREAYKQIKKVFLITNNFGGHTEKLVGQLKEGE